MLHRFSRFNTEHYPQVKYRSLLTVALFLSGTFFLERPAIAASPTPGTVIENQATGSYLDTADNQAKTVASDIVKVTVAEVAGITLTSSGTSGPSTTGGTEYFDFTVTNIGNDPTQFFIPGSPSASSGGTPTTVEVTSYDADGSGPGAPISLTGVLVPTSGAATGSLPNASTFNNGSIPAGGTITVRVGMVITASSGQTVSVTFGDTAAPPNNQNQDYSTTTAGLKDLYTQDNSGATNGDTAGSPINGDATNHRKEASDTAIVTVQTSISISGKVFEDVNYGGGAGRSYNAANTSAISSGWASGAIGSGSITPALSTIVELYQENLTGTFVQVSITTTDVNGNYSFSVPQNGTYRVRVVNSTVRSVRPGYIYGVQVPVQTYRFDPDETNAASRAITNEVGGLKPSGIDAGPVLPLTSPLPTTAQSQTEVVINNNSISGADFGYNFDTIVNTNDLGQGSLRQFVINANTLGNTNLDQDESANSVASAVTKNPGIEHSIFMIPSPSDPLGRPADGNFVSASSLDGGSGNTFKITLITPTPLVGLTLMDAGTALDGRTQTALTGDTNPASPGVSSGPEVVITGNGILSLDLLTVAGENTLIDSIGLVKAHNILTGAGALGRGLVIGSTNLLNFSNPIIVRNSTIALNDTNGILVSSAAANASDGIQLTNNVIRNNGSNNSLGNLIGAFGNGIILTTNGLSLTNGSIKNVSIQGNTIANNSENGLKVLLSAAPNVTISNLNIQSNTITGNGTGNTTAKDGISIEAVVNSSNVSVLGSSSIKDSLIFNNQISSNGGNGVSLVTHVDAVSLVTNLLTDPITGITITRNRTFNNSALGIDLEKSVLLSPQSGVTPNDNNDADIGPNGFLNFPVIESAVVAGQNLVLKGWAAPGATIELFTADAGPNPNPLPGGFTKSFGEGQTYLLTLQEGGTINNIADTDNTQSTYTNDGTGATSTKTENRFLFTIPLSSIGATVASRLTATTTINSSTSEFSGVTQVIASNPNILLVKRITAINGGTTTDGGDDLSTYNQDDAYPYDDNVLEPSLAPSTAFPTADTTYWPNTVGKASSTFLLGGRTGGQTKPQDEVEYTIYFLSAGSTPAKNVTICDRVPDHQTFVQNGYSALSAAPNGDPTSGRGIAVSYNGSLLSYTNNDDNDTAKFYPAGSTLPNVCGTATNTTGAILVNLGADATGTNISASGGTGGTLPNSTASGSPTTSYGFVRFKAKVN